MPADNIEEIKLKTGETTTINLKGLGTAGYVWNYSIDDNDINSIVISKDFIMSEKLTQKNMGASANEVFTIKAVKKGTLTIRFFQKRNWETNVEAINEKKVNVIIQ